MSEQTLRRAATLALGTLAAVALGFQCPGQPPGDVVFVPGLEHEVRVVVDRFGSPHVFAQNDTDLVRVQGYLHARDRLWQMDLTRREVSGDRAEILGQSALNGDIQNRTVGLRRAAARSLALLSDRELEVLEAYADGVNAWIGEAEASGNLPPEYAEVELTQVRRWDPLDTLAIGKGIAASLSLSIDAGLMEQLEDYVAAGEAADPPFDGFALLASDVRRSAPMDPASTVPDATGEAPFLLAGAAPAGSMRGAGEQVAGTDAEEASAARQPWPTALSIGRQDLARRAALARGFRERAAQSPFLLAAMERHERTIGSNHWGVSAARSTTGFPIIANDPHLGLGMPSTFYENHLVVKDDPFEGPMNVNGITFPGVPFVILGQNEFITWGATTNPMDVTDIFADKLRRLAGCGATLCIESGGVLHRVNLDLPAYFVNQIGDGVPDNVVSANVPLESLFIFTVPFRSFGPIVAVDDPGVILGAPGSTETTALVLQFTGFHATREVQTFRIWNRAKNLDDFKEGLRSFDFGSQNWAYADKDGNLAVFSSAENPLRVDLEAGQVEGLPPFFVRDGISGLNNWVPDPDRTQGQTIPFAVLPEEEMPQAVNPSRGFFANANNDPAGTTLDNDPLSGRRPSKPEAIYYLNPGYAEGLRAGRITRLVQAKLAGGGKISADDMKAFQANTQQLDAELLVPFLLAAHAHAGRMDAPAELVALHADPGVAEAVARLAAWDFSTPTGIVQGYDARDRDGERLPYVSPKEVAASVAATLYNVWRAKAIRSIVDTRLATLGVPGVGATDAMKALHHLLVQVPYTGVGASGVDFIPEPAALSAEDRRDLALLGALRIALDALASGDFRNAFDNSTNQDDYRWGKLHRITFSHALGGEFNVPPAGGFEDLAPGLPGVARDGGFEVVNASGFNARADRDTAFRFGGGPVRRYVGVAGAGHFPQARVVGWNVVPGGSSGDFQSPLYVKQLGMWLTADYHPVEMFEGEASRAALSRERFRAP